MSNKIALATIQFRADVKGVNPALDAIRQSSKNAHDEMNRMQEALKQGIKTMKDANGVEFNVADRLAKVTKEANSFDKALRELTKGATALETVVKNIRLGEIEASSRAELKGAINAAESRKRSVRGNDPEDLKMQRDLNTVIEESRKQLNNLDRDTQKVIETLDKGGTIAQSVLDKEQKGLLEMLSLIPKGTEEWNKYNHQLQQIEQHVANIRQKERETASSLLSSKNLGQYSDEQIRASITAAKELLSTYKTADPAAKQLAENIVRAEEHLKQYGVEAERTARREAQAVADAARKREEAHQAMENQLRRGTGLTQSALKQQEQYWQRMADDPKAATKELARYYDNLNKVHAIQKEQQESMVKAKGLSALSRFRGDVDYENKVSANQLKEDTADLKAYRDSLPKEGNLSLIREIDYYLAQTGKTARESAQAVMSLADAEVLAGKLGTNGFGASTTQLKAAKKALEEAQLSAERGSKRFSELQAAINKVDLALRETGQISKEVDAILSNPKGRSFNELKLAVEQGRQALNSMRTTTEKEKKAFDELAKKVKEADEQMKALGNSSKGSASSFEKAWGRLKTYAGLYVSAAVAMQKLTATMGDLMELSDKMGEVRKTTGFTADEVGRLTTNLKKMDTRTGIVELLDLSAAAGQLGLKTQEDVEGFTIAANKLLVALPEMGREGATEMLKVALATGEIDNIRRQMEQGLIDGSSATAVAMEKVGSTIDRLRATSAATAPAITDFVKRVGAVGAQSGITIDQVAALGSTVDALGMRVEMSATALSRMIPAIRNNAFDIAHAIGVTPDTLRNLFDAGRGMEAILMIFQHIKDAGMGEESIESMLGMGNMKEIMKELNQQGARAGIVFAGLSQNVDELRRQLGVASQAYEENIAIQQEYDKMNETTAAKWERLKNQVEEYFVGDSSQKFLGGIIDSLRSIIDLITGPFSGAFNAFLFSFGAFKLGVGAMGWKFIIGPIRETINGTRQLGVSITTLKTTWIASWKAMDAATKANWIFAIGAALYELGQWAYTAMTRVSELDQALNRLDSETDDSVRHVGRLVTAFNDASDKADKAAKRHEALKNETEALRKEVDELKKSTNLSAEATAMMNKKSSELEEKEKELKQATDESNKANKTRLQLIAEINSKYGTYLGYMLNEKTAALEVASAHQLIIAALKEERKQKGLNAIQEAVDKEYSKDLKEYSEEGQSELSNLYSSSAQRRIMEQWHRVLTAVSYDADNDRYMLSGVKGITKDATFGSEKELKDAMRKALKEIIKQEAANESGNVATRTIGGAKIYQSIDDYMFDIWGNPFDTGFGDWAETYIKRERDLMQAIKYNQIEVDQAHKQTIKAAENNQKSNLESLQKLSKENQTFTDEQIRAMAQNVNALMAGFDKYGDELTGAEDIFGKGNERTLQNAVNNLLTNLDQETRTRVLRVAQKGRGEKTGTSSVVTDITNPWGRNAPAESTDYSTWDVNELVARRDQMDKFKNILKPDTDVKAVLAEDKALMKALQEGLSSDWKSVMAWYNQERLKIQQELKSERFSTNKGHWRDDAKTKKRVNPLRESDYALAELDRYYSRRKEMLEKAREEENMSEELYNREAEMLEQEHLKKRSDLRKTFTADDSAKEQEEVKQFRQWWKALADSGDLDKVSWAKVEKEWSAATADQIGRNELKAQQDLTQLGSITVKHLNTIARLIDKERPYDGITANLRDNLTKMDILFADMDKANADALAGGGTRKYDEGDKVKAGTERLKFLLAEAETAYSATIDDVMRRMGEQGMTAWAEEIRKSQAMQNALMAQLQTAYDAIQDAIKKESSLIKKQTDIWWSDIEQGQTQSRKGRFEQMLSSLGLKEDQVKRANSLIGAGQASQRVADRLAIKQMDVQLQMQETYYHRMRQIGDERIKQLEAQGKMEDADHLRRSLNLSLTKEQTELDKQRVAIANQLEESQARLYTELREWGDLIAGSVQSLFEASNAGNAEYYNERAKLNLTGKGGPGAGTYIVIENAGTSEATASYEYLDERQALERQHEIEQENAMAEAWKKVMDDLNMKMSDMITDQLNAMLQNASIDTNTTALETNTEALGKLTQALENNLSVNGAATPGDDNATAGMPTDAAAPVHLNPEGHPGQIAENTVPDANEQADARIAASNREKEAVLKNQQDIKQGELQADKQMTKSSQNMYAAMMSAANLYGVAYQAMTNENLSAEQRFQMIALQAAGQTAIAMMSAEMFKSETGALVSLPKILAECLKINPIAGAAIFAVLSALIGAGIGVATSKLAKGKSQVAQVTGASGAGAGRISTGMLTYASGNVNEFTDPATLTPGRQYNVDAADGRTYRARYMGTNPKTHITNGPEFHLSGERGREMIIDAGTTRQITMNEGEIWRAIQTLSSGGHVRRGSTARRRGIPAFADGNVDDFDDMMSVGATGDTAMSLEQMASLKASIDRQSEVQEALLQRLNQGIKAVVSPYGPDGIVHGYDKYKKEAMRHGERYT